MALDLTPEKVAAMIEEMVPLFVAKAKTHYLDPSDDEWWEGVISTVIADTWLCFTVESFLERWKREMSSHE